jgi:hypothetical protein
VRAIWPLRDRILYEAVEHRHRVERLITRQARLAAKLKQLYSLRWQLSLWHINRQRVAPRVAFTDPASRIEGARLVCTAAKPPRVVHDAG